MGLYHRNGIWLNSDDHGLKGKTYSPSAVDYSLKELERDVKKEFEIDRGGPELAEEVYRELTYECFKEGEVTGQDILDRKTASRFVNGWS